MSEARRPPRGFAALAPEQRRAIASRGGLARRESPVPYTINASNARALADSRWNGLQTLSDATRAALERMLANETATRVASTAGIARSTLMSALRGRRVTMETQQRIALLVERDEEDQR